MVLRTDEIHLIRAAQVGDLFAFEELVRRYRTPVYRVALRMLGNAPEAEDAAQDAFFQAWQALPGFRAESSFSTWLYRIVTNRCLNLLRSQRPAEPLAEGYEVEASRPNHIVEAHAKLEALKVAVTRLTPEQRAPLILRELEGLSYEEIAEVLDTTVPAVKGRLHRTRLVLVEAMRQWR